MIKTALITGASEGIGRAIAVKLAAKGYCITGVARSADKLAVLIQQLGPGHDFIVADLSTGDGQDAIARHMKQRHYDVLINNAGIGTSGEFTDVALERQVTLLRLNCEALIRLSHAYLTRARTGDALINVSSVLAFMPMPGLGLYSATKSFVTAFSTSLWQEQKASGVYVMALHPGMTDTEFQIHAGGTKGRSRPMMSQTPDQVAEAAFNALQRREDPIVISGKRNRIFAHLPRLLPSALVVRIMGWLGSQR